jgi:AcrR family transcriptional regulator
MGYRHSEDELLDAAVAVAVDQGISSLTFGAVGHEAGVSDRTVVYYFADKTVLVGAVVNELSRRLQEVLTEAFGDAPRPVDELIRRAWPVLASRDVDPLFAVFLQILGLATSGTEPYATLAGRFVDGWIAWLAPRVLAPSVSASRRGAAAAMAQLDGLLLLRSVAGPTVANAAARELGVLA